ncbi:hypothetical protein EJD97_018774 [Solanum chilense]|uniref:Uncharacterized protein n=1 Tax=Solanum chilense TaxID=4083 RepID=A0A6N2CDY4_SOLCI|nr:hypothetical protein EJD97_018774 [Solanum chilense]
MNIRRYGCKRVKKATAGGNQSLPQAPTAGVQVCVNPAALTYGEVRKQLVQMAQAITTHGKAITAQATREGAPRKNPHASTLARILTVFTTINSPAY